MADGTTTSTSPAIVRAATPDDAAALVVLRDVMFEVMGVPPERLADDAWRHAAHDWFARRTGEHGIRITVAEVDGEVVAAAVGEVTALIPGPGAPNGSVGLVSNVATLPAYRGRGLAAAVTDDLLAWFREHTDVTRIDLFATPGGARIYEPRGFVARSFPAMSAPVPRGPA